MYIFASLLTSSQFSWQMLDANDLLLRQFVFALKQHQKYANLNTIYANNSLLLTLRHLTTSAYASISYIYVVYSISVENLVPSS